MRRGAVCLFAFACGCVPSEPQSVASYSPPPQLAAAGAEPGVTGALVERMSELVFDGGRIEIETRRDGARVIELARNRFVVPLVMHWRLDDLQNLSPTGPIAGVVMLPPAASPNGNGPAIVLATATIDDMYRPFSRDIRVHARFGDPSARPTPYAYRLPFKAGKTFSVLQGFHGAFSHRGSNEYAVDFDCPVATPVVAARPGLVVAAHAAAQGAGTTPEFLDYRRTNFVLVRHDDGTLGEYMHLAPSGVRVTVGQQVARGDELALSGNTGFSSTPHLHFQVMTAASDGFSAQSFPFELAVSAQRVEAPVQGRAYPSWE